MEPFRLISRLHFRVVPGGPICRSCRLARLHMIVRNASTARAGKRGYDPAILSGIYKGTFRPELNRFMQKPMVIVDGSSPTVYLIGTRAVAALLLSMGITNYWTVFYEQPYELSSFIKVAYGVTLAFFGFFGCLFLYKTRGIVSKISTIPYKSTTPGHVGLRLRIESYPMFQLPGKPKIITEAPIEDVEASARLGVPGYTKSSPVPPTLEEKAAERRWIREQEREQLRRNGGNFLILPFQSLAYWLRRGLKGLRDLLSDDAFVYLRIEGQPGWLKIDKEFDWALDNGHALDKLIKLRVT